MSYQYIKVDREGPVTIITLNRPDVMNALHSPAHFEMHEALDAFAADPDQWVGIITGAASGIGKEIAVRLAAQGGIPVIADTIRPVPVDSVPSFVARRAKNTAMETAKFTAATGIHPRHWREALREFVVQSPTFSRYKPLTHAP